MPEDTIVNQNREIIIKAYSAPQRLFYGIVYEPNVKDTHGHFTSEEEIEKAAHDFLPNAVMNVQHQEGSDLDVNEVQVVESYIAPCDFQVNGEVIKKGSWVLVSRVLNDDLAADIEKGECTGYSLEGTAVLVGTNG